MVECGCVVFVVYVSFECCGGVGGCIDCVFVVCVDVDDCVVI